MCSEAPGGVEACNQEVRRCSQRENSDRRYTGGNTAAIIKWLKTVSKERGAGEPKSFIDSTLSKRLE